MKAPPFEVLVLELQMLDRVRTIHMNVHLFELSDGDTRIEKIASMFGMDDVAPP